MDFLKDELKGLTDLQRAVVLKQIEGCIREIYQYFRDANYNDMSHDLALHRSAAKIFGTLDWLKKLKSSINNA